MESGTAHALLPNPSPRRDAPPQQVSNTRGRPQRVTQSVVMMSTFKRRCTCAELANQGYSGNCPDKVQSDSAQRGAPFPRCSGVHHNMPWPSVMQHLGAPQHALAQRSATPRCTTTCLGPAQCNTSVHHNMPRPSAVQHLGAPQHASAQRSAPIPPCSGVRHPPGLVGAYAPCLHDLPTSAAARPPPQRRHARTHSPG